MSTTWLIVIAAAAGFVILSGRAAAIVEWVQETFGKTTTPSGELSIIVNLVAAAKLITDPEQKKTVRAACVACFNGWLTKEIPET